MISRKFHGVSRNFSYFEKMDWNSIELKDVNINLSSFANSFQVSFSGVMKFLRVALIGSQVKN